MTDEPPTDRIRVPRAGARRLPRHGPPAEFVERFFLVAQGMKTDGVVTRIEWRYLDEVAPC